jgi:hypothetical protein
MSTSSPEPGTVGVSTFTLLKYPVRCARSRDSLNRSPENQADSICRNSRRITSSRVLLLPLDVDSPHVDPITWIDEKGHTDGLGVFVDLRDAVDVGERVPEVRQMVEMRSLLDTTSLRANGSPRRSRIKGK